MPKPFIFILPDSPLDSEEKGIPVLEEGNQLLCFLDRVNKLIDSNHIKLSSESNTQLKNFFKYIWNTRICCTELEQTRNEYKHLLDQTIIVKNILDIILVVQHQSIQIYKKLKLDKTEENQIFCLTDTKKRINFIIRIKNILAEKLYTIPELEDVRYGLLIGIFTEIEIIVKNISHGLYTNHFTQQYKTLTTYFEKTMEIAEKIFPQISHQLQYSSAIPDTKALHGILIITLYFPIYKAKIYFAQGKDEFVLSYLSKEHYLSKGPLFAILQEKGEALAQKNYMALCKSIIITQEVLATSIQSDTTRQAYITFYNCIKRYFQSDCQVFDIRVQNLKQDIACALDELIKNKVTSINSDTITSIEKCIKLLILAQRRNYDLDLNMLAICEKISIRLHNMVKTKHTVISDNIKDSLSFYAIQMDFHKQTIEQVQKESISKLQENDIQEKKTQKPDLMPSKKTKIENQLMGARQTIMHHEKEITALKAKNANLESELQSHQQPKTPPLSPKPSAIESQLTAKQILNYEKEIVDLKQKNAALETECSKVKDFKIQQRQKKKLLQQEIENLKQEIKTTKEQVAVIETELEIQFQKDTTIIEHLKRRRKFHRNNARKIEKKSVKEIKKLTEKIEALQLEVTHSFTAQQNVQQEMQQLQEERQQINQAHKMMYEQWSRDALGYYNVTRALIGDLQSQLGQRPTDSCPPPYVPAPIIYGRATPRHPTTTSTSAANPTFFKIVSFTKG